MISFHSVPNIGYAIDTGLVKLPCFDPRTGLERLIVGPVSQASAQQRAGRAGRVQSGQCYRLYTEPFLQQLPMQTPPEILRTNLTSLILTLKALGIDNILGFDLMDVPSVDAMAFGLESLYALGAIDDTTHLTKMGSDLALFPTEPRTSRMLLESLSAGCAWEVLAVAAAEQVRALWQKPTRLREQQLLDYQASMAEVVDNSGDHVTYANLLAEFESRQMDAGECKERFFNYSALRRAVEVRQQLAGILRRLGKLSGMSAATDAEIRSLAIRKCVTSGFFGNTAKLGPDGRYYTLRQHIFVTPATTSVYADAPISSEYILFGETADGKPGGIELRSVSAIEARWLRELAPHYWD